jgi:cytochrome c nitrite reductase small subunit
MIKRLLNLLTPPERWRIPVVVLLGILTGLSLYSLYVSMALSYLSDQPETCTNCHIMAPQYATWSHSSHRSWTNCNDCHVPHNNVLNKYYFKAKDGLRHATIFTLRKEPQVIFIKDAGKKAVQDNCIRCHGSLITDSKLLTRTPVYHQQRLERRCWECHQEVPHGTVNSLSSVPWARVPLPASPVPDWLKNALHK